MSRDEIAQSLLLMAAKRSTETQFGWSHPDCEALEEAARIVRGEPAPVESPVEVVLSNSTSG
jgi:hypothetical protein